MSFDITDDVTVERDATGQVRRLRHPDEPYRADGLRHLQDHGVLAAPAAPEPTEQEILALARDYVGDALPHFHIGEPFTDHFVMSLIAAPAPAPVTTAGPAAIKRIDDSISVSYPHHHAGIPVHRSGFLVRIQKAASLAVTGSLSTLRLVEAVEPDESAPFAPGNLTEQMLAQQLGLDVDHHRLSVHAKNLTYYRFRGSDSPFVRSPPARHCPDAPGEAAEALQLASIPQVLLDSAGSTFLTTRVYFSHRPTGASHRDLNTVAFVETRTGAVLFLEHLSARIIGDEPSGVQGKVFKIDPPSKGQEVSFRAPRGELDGLRDTVVLEALGSTSHSSTQDLHGEWVEIFDFAEPQAAIPRLAIGQAFDFPADTTEFAAVSAYYHCTRFFRMMEEMGFDVRQYFAGTCFPVRADHRSMVLCNVNSENAEALANPLGTAFAGFAFGRTDEREISFATSRRVVLHECGHAAMWNHIQSPTFGFAHSIGDSLAAILCDPETLVTDSARYRTFPWLPAAGLRSRRHDRKPGDGFIWNNSEAKELEREQMLSTTLFRVYETATGAVPTPERKQLAAQYVAYLLLKAVGLLHSESNPNSAEDFADTLIQTDSGTFRFQDRPYPCGLLPKVIRWCFEFQGAYNPPKNSDHGEPPEIDLYVANSRYGVYKPSLVEDFWQNINIWNRHRPDHGVEHETPDPGQDNFCYVRLSNRGIRAVARTVTVRGYHSARAMQQTWPDDWQPLAEPEIVLKGLVIPPRSKSPVVAGPFRWRPHSATDALLFGASTEGDRCHLDTVQDSVETSWLVPFDNNLGQRNAGNF